MDTSRGRNEVAEEREDVTLSRIELLHFLAFMFDNLLDELSCIRIQHRDRLLSSV